MEFVILIYDTLANFLSFFGNFTNITKYYDYDYDYDYNLLNNTFKLQTF